MISLPTQVLELSGTDAAAFAHAQFCNDVLGLPDEHWQWNAWLSAQGRVRALFLLLRMNAADLRLILRGDGADYLRAELARYTFRAQVQLRVANEARLGATDAAAEITAAAGTLPGASVIVSRAGIVALTLPGDPPRWLALDHDKTSASDAAPLERWRLADIRAGLPEIGAELRERLLPQWLGLDRLRAVSVRKGCYPGQEIMARLHFKGGNKRSLYRLRWPGQAIHPPATILRGPDGAEAGVIVMCARDVERGCVEALASLSGETVPAVLETESAQDGAIAVVECFA